MAQLIKESACNAGDLGFIPGLGRSPGEGMATHSSILTWEIPWTQELGRLQSMDSQEQQNHHHTPGGKKLKQRLLFQIFDKYQLSEGSLIRGMFC